jgi:hypothetical protein
VFFRTPYCTIPERIIELDGGRGEEEMRFGAGESLALRIQLLIIITFSLVEGVCEAPLVMKAPDSSG